RGGPGKGTGGTVVRNLGHKGKGRVPGQQYGNRQDPMSFRPLPAPFPDREFRTRGPGGHDQQGGRGIQQYRGNPRGERGWGFGLYGQCGGRGGHGGQIPKDLTG